MMRALSAMLLIGVLAAAPYEEAQTLKVDVDLVNVYFTVCNHKGKLITKLGRDSFSVFEDGQPQTVTNFSQESDVPLTIVLLVDTSGSVRYKLQFEKEAAVAFLLTTLRRGRDKAALVTFNHAFELQQDYTDDPAVIARALR